VSVVAGIAITTLAVGWWSAVLTGAAVVAVVATGTLARRKIGGISGDVLGATEQVAECLCLVALSAQAR
jgi:adenosylcobinamide-GDP ribazoletransferase